MRQYKGRISGITVEPRLDYKKGWVDGDLVGRNIKILAALYGLSQRDIANYIGKAQSEISRVTRGAWKKFPLDLTLEIADAFNINPRILLDGDLSKKVMEALNEP